MGYELCKNCDTTKYQQRGQTDAPFQSELVNQPVYLILIAMSFWSILAFLFARWFEEVCPWQDDTAIKSPLFCLNFIRKKYNLNKQEEQPIDPKYFERSMTDREVGLEIKRLSKSFRGIPVVQDLSFKIYRGETTLLLGHNGAGKTTLMNMILGRLQPDEGRVLIQPSQHDPNQKLGVGVCPQISILDNNLSVYQHLELFASIKSSSIKGFSKLHHIKTTIEDVSLTSHMHKLPSELSGGMKRKLSLAMAFVGESNVLILDEPSSGLDPDSRVFIWNAIRRYRADRTVLLSTQHMEEADYLGDRIAIMSGGRIICCGSSTFLNNTFGSGYKLRVECRESKKQQILDLIKHHFENAKPDENLQITDSKAHTSGSPNASALVDIVVELNSQHSSNPESSLIRLLEDIEAKSGQLGIVSHGLKSSSLEDVLLSTDKSFNKDSKDNVRLAMCSISTHIATVVAPSRDISASKDHWPQIMALIIKHLNTYRRNLLSIGFYRIFLPLLLFYLIFHNLPAIVVNYEPSLNYALVIMHLVYFPTSERASKFKTMQLTSNIGFITYWVAFLLIDMLSTLAIVMSADLMFWLGFYGDYLVSSYKIYLVISIGGLLLGIASSILAYLLSFIFTDSSTCVGYSAIIYYSSFMVSLLFKILTPLIRVDLSKISKLFTYLFIGIFPTEAFAYTIYGLQSKCYLKQQNFMCIELPELSPVIVGLCVMLCQIFVYASLLYFFESYNIDVWRYINPRLWFGSRKSPVILDYRDDQDVLNETANAMNLIRSPDEGHSLLVSGVSKSYIPGVKVVQKLSFTVKKGECFGLLGVNGAGKSTTFAMLVAEFRPDTGIIKANGKYSSGNLAEYCRSIGYDPQSNPEMWLSPVEALVLMAKLRSVDPYAVPMLVDSVLELLNMSEHKYKRADQLSGGTKRKLALGMSLIGNPSLLALDEPTAGVDPIARRGIWRLLRALRTKSGISIVISSHAMEECEAICDRISIMARGRLRCIGTFLHLRSKFSQGCSVKIQFSHKASGDGSSREQTPVRRNSQGSSNRRNSQSVEEIVAEIKSRLEKELGSSVRLSDKNVNSATFNISSDSVRRSHLFKLLRQFKQKHPEISYMVNDSSLEDIFIALAREQQQLEQTQPQQL